MADHRDTWRDPDADSGLRLDSWLAEGADRGVLAMRDPDTRQWTVSLTEGRREAARGRAAHIDEAWLRALSDLRAREEHAA